MGTRAPASNGTTSLPTSLASSSSRSIRPVRVWLDTNQLYSGAGDCIQQPQTQQFANFEATPSPVLNGTVIDVNAHVVVYTVKNGLIRVLHRHSTLRTLLRAHHQQNVTDIRFFQDGDVLATAASSDTSSSIVIWRIYEGAADINSDKILEMTTPHMNISRVIWHPFNPNQFWMIHQNKNITNNGGSLLGPTVATLVETTSISTRKHDTDKHAVCEFFSNHVLRQGVIQLSYSTNSNLTDLAWSGRDTRHVMTTHDSGEVILWDLQQTTPSTTTPYTLTPTRLATITNASESGPITRCLFLPHENMSSVSTSTTTTSNDTLLTTCFATASDNNSIITLWSPFVATSSSSSSNAALPTKVQVIGLEQPSTSYLVDLVFGPAPPDASPPSCFLLMADRTSGKILAHHVRAVWSDGASITNAGGGQHRSVLLEGCDYVVPFMTRYPTFAWSVVVSPSTDIAEEALTEQGSLIFDMKLFSYQSRLVQCLTLTSYMCLPPSSTTTSSSGVVRVEPLSSSSGGPLGGSSNVSEIDDTDVVAPRHTTLEQYDEDYDVGDDDDQQDDDDDDVYADAEPAPAIQPPGVALAGAAGTTSNLSSPFANWLGAIAGTSITAAAAASSSPSSAPPPPGLGGLLPPGAATTPPPPPAAPPASALPPPIGVSGGGGGGGSTLIPGLAGGFLSPSDFVIVPPAAAASPAPAVAPAPAPIVPPIKKTESKKEKKNKKTSAVASPPPAPPGGLQILKRDDAPPSPPHPAAAVAPPVAAVVDMQEMRRIVREEVQSQVVPAVERAVSQAMQPMQLSIQELIQKGVSVDNDKIALTMAESIDEPLQAVFAQTIKTVLIPTLESMTGQIFGKVSHSLDQGLASASAAAASAAAAAANGGGGSAPRLEAISTQLSTMTALVAELTGEVQSLRATVAAQQTAVAAAAAAASHAHQPAPQKPPADSIETVKGEIIKLLSEKNYEKAFTRAVSSTTAELAVFCCSHADLTEVLGCADEIKLSQPILICLMQQLGTVVGSPSSHSSNLQVELEWLQDIALSLDPKDTTIQQHIPRVLQGLVANINARLVGGGDPALRRPLQRLLSILRGIRIG